MAAAGQLMLQTSTGASNPLPVLVLPDDIMNHYKSDLRRINICVIGFHWQGAKVVFHGLEQIRFT